ncbi:uncharacterized protein E0L32_001446 [Thyridium curvatum]|uniref:Mediator of RNA polymerase II transcription subunit 13 n=1 Tax=Thyridium curvatum TaxID=1093900 RepID=A0A507AZ00_9PEZI|nr:uncharacterized protein E0L32_001446 [Thyridium curvatum]TPX10249.1 hypothetical protein E0L32_001446 [Thyridium curvatum]
MDATECDTNCFLINNISTVSYHVYEPATPQATTYSSKAFEIESLLRNDGRLVYVDPVRRVLWCFQLIAKDGSTIGTATKPGATLEVSGFKLKLIEDGSLDPANLSKGKVTGANAINTPNSSSPSVTAPEPVSSTAQGLGATPSQSSLGGGSEVDQKTSTSSNALSDVKGQSVPSAKEVYKCFVSAVLSSLTSAFCCQTGAVMLSPGSLLLPKRLTSSEDEPEATCPSVSIMATFRIYMTTTGSLVISLLHTLVSGLECASRSLPTSTIHMSTPVLAAPLGTFASFHALEQDMLSLDINSIHSPDTQIVRRRPEIQDRQSQWCERFAKILQARGLSSTLLDGATWLHLRRQSRHRKVDGKQTPIENPSSTILWPSTLCFWRACSSPGLGRSTANSEQQSGFDPLLGARKWFTRNGERAEVLAQRTRDRESLSSRQVDAEHPSNQPNGHSPLALRRASNTGPLPGAAGSMYPTPPDGIQNPVGVTPSFDGNVSSPGNAPATAAVADPDITMGQAGNTADSFGEGWDGPKRERHSTSFMDDPDNMFDDIGTDMFADNDITDADFNFFDEQPEVTGLDFPMPDIPPGPEQVQNIDHSVEPILRTSRPVAEPALNPPADTPKFAKPELKHARSSLQDDLQARANLNEEPTVPPTVGVKRQPSPFTPDSVFKRIRAAMDSPLNNAANTNHGGRRRSVFDSVDFNSFLTLNNKKYEENGRFECHWEKPTPSSADPSADIPTTAYLRRHGGVQSYLKIPPSTLGAVVGRGGGDEQGAVSKFADSDADDDSIVSELDDASHSIHDVPSPSKSSVARKRIDDDASSLAASFKELEAVSASPQAADISRFLSNDPTDLQLSKYFAEPDLPPIQYSFSDDEYITIAQILTEQVVSGTLKTRDPVPGQLDLQNARRAVANCARSSLQTVRSTFPSSLASALEIAFRSLVEVQDLPTLPQPTRLQPRNPAGAEQTRPSVFQIPSPHIEIRRHETKLSLVPSSITFWEVLGLGPSPGSKDIRSSCVFPQGEGMSDSVTSFLDQKRIVYEALKLGSFDRLADSAGITGGLVPFETEPPVSSPNSAGGKDAPPMMERMSHLCQALASQSVSNKNFLVYFLYSAEDPRSMVECCAAFHHLFELYKKKLADKKTNSTNDLVMQLVPLDLIASPQSPVVLKHGDYIKLSLETYDRCTLFDGTMPAPAICLEQLPPRMIDFKLTMTPSANLLHENSCIHIAYAQSVDGRWITAAWTDNRGSKQMTASYCLGRKGRPLATPMADVAHEIWDTTHDLISMWKVHWRVIITKCAPMEREEIDYWVDLAKAETKASITLTILTVDTDPSLQLLPPAVKMPVSASSVFYTTPVSTPQASIVSPEQSGNPPTPSMAAATSGVTATTPGTGDAATENDGDTTLVDVTDSTWGAVLSHKLQNTSAPGEINPALISGYLIKRGGTRPEDPPVVMEVNVVHAEHNPRLYETLLREMLLYFRGLGTLARARNIVDSRTDIRPWHIAAAEKAVRLLSQLM